jgi:peptidoglycan/xylan/chitin deacetylase (PgdA/CDA1 family)
MLGLRVRYRTVVIYYHQIKRKERRAFAWQMDHLLRWAKPIRIEQLDSATCDSHRVAVTADDGWHSFLVNALPELESRNIPVAIFVVSHLLNDRFGSKSDRLLSGSELIGLKRDLVTVGSHTATHIRLEGASPYEVLREFRLSRARLGELLDSDVQWFCFPFGAHDNRSVELCRVAGYARAFGGQATPPGRLPEAFLVGRVRADPSDWPLEFYLKVKGAYGGLWAVASLNRWARTWFRAKTASVRGVAAQSSKYLDQHPGPQGRDLPELNGE